MKISIFKANIREQARIRKMKVHELCKGLGVGRNYIAQLTNPRLKTIINISEVIGCKPEDLMKGM